MNSALLVNHVSNHFATVSYTRYETPKHPIDMVAWVFNKYPLITRVELTKSWLNTTGDNKKLTITHVKEVPFTRFSEEIRSMTSADLDGWGSCQPRDPLNSRDKLIEAGFLQPTGSGLPTLDIDAKGVDKALAELVDIQNGNPPWPIDNKTPWSDDVDSVLTEPKSDLTFSV